MFGSHRSLTVTVLAWTSVMLGGVGAAADAASLDVSAQARSLSQSSVLADERVVVRLSARRSQRVRVRALVARTRFTTQTTVRLRGRTAKLLRLRLTRAGRIALARDREACRSTTVKVFAGLPVGRNGYRRQRKVAIRLKRDPGCGSATPSPGNAEPSKWRTVPAKYGVSKEENVEIRLSDGTRVLADIYRPSDPQTGQLAKGPFPVILAQTPYKKSSRLTTRYADDFGKGALGTYGGDGYYPYLVARGYINAVVETRGTGSSQGLWQLQDEREQKDHAEVVSWAAKIPLSNGEIGLAGASYLGGNQFVTAGTVGRGSPVKAIAPTVPAYDGYRDFIFPGGMFLRTFMNFFLFASRTATSDLTPPDDASSHPVEALTTAITHGGNLAGFTLPAFLNLNTGGGLRYDSRFWQSRDWSQHFDDIVANDIPALIIGGHWDVFQRSASLHHAGLQNAWSGRPIFTPMAKDQSVTPRYQTVIGPWYHINSFQTERYQQMLLEWYDTWLKDEDTAFRHARETFHVYDLGQNKWMDGNVYPSPSTHVTTMYLDDGPTGSATSLNDGSLSEAKPTDTAADSLPQLSVPQPCARQAEQWSSGIASLAAFWAGVPANNANPCLGDDRPMQATGLTYTTPALDGTKALAGPITATVYASSSKTNAAFFATVEDVYPDGKSYPLTSGQLMGNLRATDANRSWALDGKLVLPWHPMRKEDDKPLVPYEVERFDIEVLPTLATLRRGHRLRLTLTTSLDPFLTPVSLDEYAGIEGATYSIQRTPAHPSHMNVPLVPVSSMKESPRDYGDCHGGC